MRGLPQTVSALTTANTDDVLAVLFVEAELAHTGEIMRRMLAQFAAQAVCVFDPATRQIIGTTDETTQGAILAAWAAASGGESVFTPQASNKSSVLWNVGTDDLLLGDLLANAYQRRTFYNLVSAGLGKIISLPSAEPCVLVDQTTGEIRFKLCELDLSGVTAAGQTVCIKLSEERTRLIFE
jgi:hypothetical protein